MWQLDASPPYIASINGRNKSAIGLTMRDWHGSSLIQNRFLHSDKGSIGLSGISRGSLMTLEVVWFFSCIVNLNTHNRTQEILFFGNSFKYFSTHIHTLFSLSHFFLRFHLPANLLLSICLSPSLSQSHYRPFSPALISPSIFFVPGISRGGLMTLVVMRLF